MVPTLGNMEHFINALDLDVLVKHFNIHLTTFI